MIYYHVTKLSNWEKIKKEGLLPKKGERSKEIGEDGKSIYLFPSKQYMDEALSQWLGDWYEENYSENIRLCSIKVDLPDEFPVIDGDVDYERIVKIPIPSKYLTFLQEE